MSKNKQKTQATKPNKMVTFNEHHLRARGYKYKLLHLTDEERDELENGRKVYLEDGSIKVEPDGTPTKLIPRDFDFWWKDCDGTEVQITKAGPDFYYNGGRITHPDALSLIEEHAKQEKIYAPMRAMAKDTQPIPSILDAPVLAVLEDAAPDLDKLPPEFIYLKDGPAHGKMVRWNRAFNFFAYQYQVGNKIYMARYGRPAKKYREDGIEMERLVDNRVYIFMNYL